MRRLAALIVPLILAATAAEAAPIGPVAKVNITVSDKLRAQTKMVSAQDIAFLTTRLRTLVEGELKRTGALTASGGRLDLVIEDARSNRPTLAEMSYRPSLSWESHGIGGAQITGTYTDAAGKITPMKYEWYDQDISDTFFASTWRGANDAFYRFAWSLVR